MFGKNASRSGISGSGSLLDMGVELGLIGKSGAYFSYGDQRLGQGRENARAFLETNVPVMAEIEAKIRQKANETPVLKEIALEEDEEEADL